MTRVLIVDDEDSMRHMLSLSLSRDGFTVWTAASGLEALEQLKTSDDFDICVTHVRMPGMDRLAVIEEAQRLGERAPTFIAMSAYGDKQLALEALRRGAFDYISKPFEPAELSLKLRLVVERDRLAGGSTQDSTSPQRQRVLTLDDIILVSPAMHEVARTVRKVARFPTTVLITGETGTGKEVIAQSIHSEGDRRSKPFVAINCGAIPENLLESELFGHAKGAFTDASQARVGLFEEANGGTLFLDEIAELPITLQVKLLRVLVEGRIRRLGESTTIAADVRVIAATSRDLDKLLESGQFREDLFHRLNVITVCVPPLRDRPDDIPPLVEHFTQRFSTRLNLDAHVDEDAMAVLVKYAWPGNVRELENALERAFVLSDAGGRVGAADLDDRFDGSTAPGDRSSAQGSDEDLTLRSRMRALERSLIAKALARTNGNRSQAASLLGISQRALLYKLKDYGIS